MIRSLRESKAKLSELVDLASRGEDVLISVRGKVKARLTSAGLTAAAPMGSRWARELRALQRAHAAGGTRAGVEQILSELREDRL
jgi:prevent-host-death family protein